MLATSSCSHRCMESCKVLAPAAWRRCCVVCQPLGPCLKAPPREDMLTGACLARQQLSEQDRRCIDLQIGALQENKEEACIVTGGANEHKPGSLAGCRLWHALEGGGPCGTLLK